MTERGSLLDLPDEPPRQWRGVPAALLGAAIMLAAGVVVARTFGLGGWVRPWLAVEAVVAVPSMIVAWLLAGPHRQRTSLTTGVMVVALALQPLAASGATLSTSRLVQTIDAMDIPGETIRDVRIGNGRCRPACSELRRTSIARGVAYAKARGQLDSRLRLHGFEVKLYPHGPGEPERMDAVNDKILGSFELRVVEPGVTRIAQVWIARGPSSDYEVG